MLMCAETDHIVVESREVEPCLALKRHKQGCFLLFWPVFNLKHRGVVRDLVVF